MQFNVNNFQPMKNIFFFALLAILLANCNNTPIKNKPTKQVTLNKIITEKNVETNSKENKTDAITTDNKTAESTNKTEAITTKNTANQTVINSNKKIKKSYNTVWSELSDNFVLSEQHTSKYDTYISDYLNKKKLLTKLSERSKPYLYHILQEVKKRNMPYEIVLLPAVESGFLPTAKSSMKAAGLWQFMPKTARQYKLQRNWWHDQRLDVVHSTNAALNYLNFLYKLNNNDWLLALASYNVGYGNIMKAQKKFSKEHPYKDANFWNIRKYLPVETRDYVPKLLAISYLVKYRYKYKVILENVPNTPLVKTIVLKNQVNLRKISKLTKISLNTLKKLNPGYLRSTTPPTGNNYLLFPTDKIQTFQDKLSQNENVFSVKWIKHKIKRNENLSSISLKYKSSVIKIKQLNHMKNNLIHEGKIILIPIYNNTTSRYRKNIKHLTSNKKVIYTVKTGQSLWLVAKKYGVKIHEIARWNNLKPSKILKTGKKLIIWL